jgi:hypothetical protein
VRGRILRQHRSFDGGFVWQTRNLAHLEPRAAQLQRRHALIKAHRVGNVNLLRPQALRHAHMPLAADYSVGSGRLRQDVAGSHVARIVAIVDIQIQTETGGFA